MAAQENAPTHHSPQHFHGSPQPLLIDFRSAKGRAVRALLAKGKIVAQHRDPSLGEILCKGYEQR